MHQSLQGATFHVFFAPSAENVQISVVFAVCLLRVLLGQGFRITYQRRNSANIQTPVQQRTKVISGKQLRAIVPSESREGRFCAMSKKSRCFLSRAKRNRNHRHLRAELLEPRLVLATMMVTTLDDGPVDTVPGSLRQAIHDANAAPTADTIEFGTGLTGAILLTEGQLEITDDLTIDGPGSANLSIDAGGASRVFSVYHPTSDVSATLRGLTVTGGHGLDGGAIYSTETLLVDDCTISDSVSDHNGGGILATAGAPLTVTNTTINGNLAMEDGGGIHAKSLSITNSTISGNSSIDDGGGIYARFSLSIASSTISANNADDGGGIRFETGHLSIVNSLINDNSAIDDGGGILSDYNAQAFIIDSRISGNSSTDDGGGIYSKHGYISITNSLIDGNSADDGGGIVSGVAGSTVIIHDSTIRENTAVDDGGGLLSRIGSHVTITSSTISQNSTLNRGGGIAGFGGTVFTLTNVTVSENSANSAGGMLADHVDVDLINSTITQNVANISGGGIYFEGTGGNTLANSIVANNAAGSSGGDVFGTFYATYSLIENTSGANISGISNITGADPLLGPLQNNGGLTETHELLPGSPAIDVGDPTAMAGVGNVPEFDQRGMPFGRVEDGDGDMIERIDIGAYEVQSAPVVDGDFNNDGTYDCLDIDDLVGQIAAGTHNPAYDLTGDSLVDLADRDAWLAEAGEVNLGPGKAYRLGDATLDGVVDVSDFNTWNVNKFGTLTVIPGWCLANFNADNVVDTSDFNIWNNNKFTASDMAITVITRPQYSTANRVVTQEVVPEDHLVDETLIAPPLPRHITHTIVTEAKRVLPSNAAGTSSPTPVDELAIDVAFASWARGLGE